MKQWWESTLINSEALKKISLALRRGRQLEKQAKKPIVIETVEPETDSR
jgi:hypothetical protein